MVLPKFGFEGSRAGVYKMMAAMGPYACSPMQQQIFTLHPRWNNPSLRSSQRRSTATGTEKQFKGLSRAGWWLAAVIPRPPGTPLSPRVRWA